MSLLMFITIMSFQKKKRFHKKNSIVEKIDE